MPATRPQTCVSARNPALVFLGGLEEIFFPQPIKVLSGNLGKALWSGGRGLLPPSPLAAAILKGVSPTPPTAEEEETGGSADNETGSGGDDDGQQKMFGRPECTPKRDQFMCTFKELRKTASSDKDFQSATDALKKGVETCKNLLLKQCSPSTAEENNCVAQAHIPLILGFVDNILSCMKDKGYTLPPLHLPRLLKITPPPRLQPSLLP